MTKWPQMNLGGCVDLLAGFAFESSRFSDDPEDVALVKGANVHQGYIDWADAKRWPRGEFDHYAKFRLHVDDVVLAMDRPWIEAGLKFAWIRRGDPKCLLVQRVARLRGQNGLASQYLRYLVGSPAFTNYIKPIVTGVNVPHISGEQIKGFTFPLPPLATQRKIAAILSAYDDLIENNLRRIKILEEMAQRLYREWFVKFRFPGHEKVRMVDSPLGKIPQGWEVKTVGEFGSVITGKTPSKRRPEFYGTAVPFIKTPDMHGNIFIIETGEYLSVEGATSQRNKTLSPNSLCVSCIGTVGIVSMTTEPAQTNQQINSIVLGESIYREFLYFALKDLKGIIQQYGATGATMTNLSKGKFESLVIVYPTVEILGRYSKLTSPMFDLIKNLQSKVFVLKGTRDLLLPKLISGELDVAHFACL